MKRPPARGFTLVELLVVIAIVAILAAVVVLIINPLELTKRSRDATRLQDLSNLQQAINVALQESAISSATPLCNGAAMPCTGTSNAVGASTRKADGTGWVKVNLSGGQAITVSTLPVDPLNSGTNIYTYTTNSTASSPTWEIDTVLESVQQKPKMGTDGGSNINAYEVGTDLNVILP